MVEYNDKRILWPYLYLQPSKMKPFLASSPICFDPKTRSIQWWRFCETWNDSSACRWIKINNRESFPDQGGKVTWWTSFPFWRSPKLKFSLFTKNSGKKKNSGMSSFTSVAESWLASRYAVSIEWNVLSFKRGHMMVTVMLVTSLCWWQFLDFGDRKKYIDVTCNQQFFTNTFGVQHPSPTST